MSRPRVAVVGYGAAGQAIAMLAHSAGFDVEVHERVASPGPVGAGFLLQPTGCWALDQLGLADAARAVGAPVEQLLGVTPAGRTVMDLRYAASSMASCGLGMQRGALFQILHAAMPADVRRWFGHEVVAVDAESGWLTTADGVRHGPYALLILADGAASRLRRAADVRRDRPYAWGAAWGLCAAPPWLGQRLIQRYGGTRRMAGLLPVGRLPGEPDAVHRACFYWSAPAEQLDAVCAAGSLGLRADLRALWPDAADWLETQPLQLHAARYRDAVSRTPGSGRVIRIGDALHAMSPQLGQGVNLALLDAVALGQILAAEPDAAPEVLRRRLMQARRRHVAIYQWLSRWLTPWFQSDSRWLGPVRDWLAGPVARIPGLDRLAARVLSGQLGWSESKGLV